MSKLLRIRDFIKEHNGQARLIHHDAAIRSMHDAQMLFDIHRSAPVYILHSNEGVRALIAAYDEHHIPWRRFSRDHGLHHLHLSTPKEVETITGYPVGAVGPLFLPIPVFFDLRLMQFDTVLCGTGSFHDTLEIPPALILATYQGGNLTQVEINQSEATS